jgi:transcriptional regulator with XRE-family HTH domain
MSQKHNTEYPFGSLGSRLKKMRVGRQESLAEVSGAVEIDIEMLTLIEEGKERPAEDILLLLISHFAVKEDEAVKLWEMAGYTGHQLPAGPIQQDDSGLSQVVAMPADTRIVYTDMVHVMVNNYGVVMNFMQGAGPHNQPMAVARIGMSKEHARSVLEVLQKTLDQSEPKGLPAPENGPQSRAEDKKQT